MSVKFILRNVDSGEEHKLGKFSMLIGRSPSCEITTAKGHPSREHARIVQSKDGVFVEDLHSTNGTYVNNRRVSSATFLQERDVITIGGESFILASHLNPDVTVVAGKLSDNADEACILIAEDDDVDATQVREPYPLPKEWSLDSRNEDFTRADLKKSSFEINQLISEVASVNGEIYSAALLIFMSKKPPLVCGLSLEQGNTQWSFGRGKHCSFIVDDPCMSDCHAILYYQQGGWLISDNQSTNGIRCDGQRCQSLKLKDGMEFNVGRLTALFRTIKII